MANTSKTLNAHGLTADAILKAALNTPLPANDPPLLTRAKEKRKTATKKAKG